jgi:hypothetical protein
VAFADQLEQAKERLVADDAPSSCTPDLSCCSPDLDGSVPVTLLKERP